MAEIVRYILYSREILEKKLNEILEILQVTSIK